MSYTDENKPIVRTDDQGNTVLDDPTAMGMIDAVSRHNCRLVYEAQLDRVDHFVRRMEQRGDDPKDVVIVLVNVDDPNGRIVGDALMPGFDWQAIRDRGEIPFARGLAGRAGIQDMLAAFDLPGSIKLSEATTKHPVCVVVDHGFSEVIEAK